MICLSDKNKILKIIEATDISKSEFARRLDVNYKTVYRWIDLNILPQPRQSKNIDKLFKEYVDLRESVYELKKTSPNPLNVIKTDKKTRDKLFLEVTYNSNAMEGSRMTIKETENAFSGKLNKSKEFFEALQAVNHRNALEYVIDNVKPNFKITKEYILKLHEIVMYNFSNNLPGKYRNGPVNLKNNEKKLPNAQEVPFLMGKFINDVNVSKKDFIAKFAKDHCEFESIHPFSDGNGRVGRLILLTQLLSKGFPPSIIKVEDTHKYFMALNKGDLGDFGSMIQLLCETVMAGYTFLQN